MFWMPDRLSVALRLTVTSLVYQPLLPAVPLATEVVVTGGVRSMLMPETVALAVLPALSVAVPVAVWPAPSPERVTGPVTLATPDCPPMAVKLTVTGALYQPLAFGGRSGAPVMVSGVDGWSSSKIVKVAVPRSPIVGPPTGLDSLRITV